MGKVVIENDTGRRMNEVVRLFQVDGAWFLTDHLGDTFILERIENMEDTDGFDN